MLSPRGLATSRPGGGGQSGIFREILAALTLVHSVQAICTQLVMSRLFVQHGAHMVRDSRITAAVDQAMNTIVVTARDVAEQVDVSYDALASYRAGRRGAPASLLEKLADILELKATALQTVARKLRKEAERAA